MSYLAVLGCILLFAEVLLKRVVLALAPVFFFALVSPCTVAVASSIFISAVFFAQFVWASGSSAPFTSSLLWGTSKGWVLAAR